MSLLSGVLSGAPQALFGIKDIKRGKDVGDSRFEQVSYTHLLPVSLRRKSRLIVEVRPENMDADTLTAHFGPKVVGFESVRGQSGYVRGVLRPNGPRRELLVEEANLAEGLHGKGIGKAMYEALYREAHELGATHVKGGTHSTNAHHVHESLAAKHGWAYDAIPNTTDEGGDWPPEDWAGDTRGGSRDDRWQRYSFELKGVRR